MNIDFDLASGQVGVDGALGAIIDDALDSDNVLVANGLSEAVRLGMSLRIKDQLGYAISVSEVDEDDAAVVAPGRNPSAEDGFLAGVFGPEFATGVCASEVHANLHDPACRARLAPSSRT